MTLRLGLPLLLAALALGSPASSCSHGSIRQDRAPATFDLPSLSPLPDAVPSGLFRSTYAHLDSQEYEAKLKGALVSPLLFFRSFVNTYYQDLDSLNPGTPLGICLGDPHPENFGFLRFGKETRYAFNDLDDSGRCPLLWDVLRYFTALRLMGSDSKLREALVDEYADIVRGKSKPKDLRQGLFPDLDKKREALLKKHVKDDRFVAAPELLAPSASETSAIRAAWTASNLSGSILDLRSVPRATGGSGGLRRFWLLVRPGVGPRRELLELKQLARAGTSFGRWNGTAKTEPAGDRIRASAAKIWTGTPNWFRVVEIGEDTFVLRSREKDSLNLSKLSDKEREEVLKAQVGLLARHHRTAGLALPDHFKKWLEETSESEARRFERSRTQLGK